MSEAVFKILKNTALRRSDDRGYLDVLFEQDQLVLKRSFSKAGVFRGMHWQHPPHRQIKIIRVETGRILDFIANPTLIPSQLHRRELSPADGWVQIEANMAHGFYAIEDTVFEYICIGAYNESAEHSYSIFTVLNSELELKNLTLSNKDLAAKPLTLRNIPE